MVITPVPSTESQPGMHGQKPNRFRLTFAKLTPLSSSMRIFAAPGQLEQLSGFPLPNAQHHPRFPPALSSTSRGHSRHHVEWAERGGPTHWGVCWSWSQIYWTSASCPVCSYFMRAFDKKASHFSLCLASFSFCFCSFFFLLQQSFRCCFCDCLLGRACLNEETKSWKAWTVFTP